MVCSRLGGCCWGLARPHAASQRLECLALHAARCPARHRQLRVLPVNCAESCMPAATAAELAAAPAGTANADSHVHFFIDFNPASSATCPAAVRPWHPDCPAAVGCHDFPHWRSDWRAEQPDRSCVWWHAGCVAVDGLA